VRRGKATEPDDGRPRRLPLDVRNAVVRVEVPTATAADLTPRQLATARELGVPDLAKYAGALALHNARRENGESFEPRRANEPTGGVILRRRHHDALAFARWLVLELVALRPIAEAAPVLEPDASTAPDAWQLARLIETVERARSHWTHDGRTDEAPRRIGAVRDALEHARQWHAQHLANPPVDGFGTFPVDVDVILEGAIRADPALAPISLDEWRGAIDAWPGLPRGRGGARRKGRPIVTWYRVVFELLKPHGLTDASSAESLKKTFEGAPTKRARPSRAK